MNKKILVLAFVSVSFLFGCTAEGFNNTSNNNQPEWDGKPPSAGGPSTGPGPQGCDFYGLCYEKGEDGFTMCINNGGTPVDSCD